MENITSSIGLKNAIQSLEIEQATIEQHLKEQFYIIQESFKPVNLLRSTFLDVVSSPHLIDDILGTAVGLATGFVSKKIVIGASGNLIRKLLGSITQLGVTTVVAQHPGAIKSVGQFIIQHIFRNKKNE
jgi:hypothetical protein